MSPPGLQRPADGLRYGALGAPLAFAALPLYVQLPNHYAAELGVSLAGLGAVLLAVRGLDAVVDPWLGRVADRVMAGARARVLQLAGAAALLLALGLGAVFFPPAAASGALLAWCAVALLFTFFGYSSLGVLHQAWGARLGGGDRHQAWLAGWREGLALAGVLLASVLPAVAGLGTTVLACAAGLALALLGLSRAPFVPGAPRDEALPGQPAARPWHDARFRRLMGVYLLNGIAAAVPATLVLFYIRDHLQAPAQEPLFLAAYFAAAAGSVPVWLRGVARFGLVRCWLAGMVLAVASFAWAAQLAPGAVAAYALVCVACGLALGADLVVPSALLTSVIQRAGHARRHEGAYVGWWSCATKLNLALAAGLALPALQALGYRPGQTAGPTDALVVCYAVLPCLLKLAAAALLWHHRSLLEGPDR
ncbi:MAG: MFS transporter [Burkholderiales bacterium]|nr:MFS transporter [Burkholderiales bacterium]